MSRDWLIAILIVSPAAFFSAVMYVYAADPIVPCSGSGCMACHFITLAQRIINFLVIASVFISVIMFAVAGFIMITSGGDPGKVTLAKGIFVKVVVGLIIVLGAWLIVDVVLKALTGKGFEVSPFTSIRCVPQTPLAQRTVGVGGGGGLGSGSGTGTGTGTGSCSPVTSGPCSVASLQARGGVFSDASIATQASSICRAESGGIHNVKPGTDKLWHDGRGFSFGLFQINLVANRITCNGVTLNCPSAFQLVDSSCRQASWGRACGRLGFGYKVVNESLYQRCKSAAENVSCNINRAQALIRDGQSRNNTWQHWATSKGRCNL